MSGLREGGGLNLKPAGDNCGSYRGPTSKTVRRRLVEGKPRPPPSLGLMDERQFCACSYLVVVVVVVFFIMW